jgi:hypothetical protein
LNTITRGIIALSGAALVVTALALALVNDNAQAADPGNLDVVAIDLDATGNQPQTLGTTEGCRDGLSDGNTFDIDVVVKGINAADGVSGIGANITYDPAVLQINARGAAAVHMFMQAAPLGTYFDAFSDSLPDTDGDYRHDAAEIGGTAESGDGVLMRLTVEIVGAGNTVLDLTDNVESDGNPNVLAFNGNPIIPLQVGDAQIYADGSTTCGAATPSPTPGPTVSPDPTQAPTDTPIPTPTPTIPVTPTPTRAPSGGGTTCNTTLTAAAAVGATTISVASAAGCTAGDTIRIGSGSGSEDVKIASVSGNTITLVAGLKKAQVAGATVVEVTTTGGGGSTPGSQPATGAGSDGGVSTVLLLVIGAAGVALLAVAGGSLAVARARREE